MPERPGGEEGPEIPPLEAAEVAVLEDGHLFLLRRGCLFHVSVDDGLRVLDAVEVAPASPPGTRPRRYDRVLVEGSRVVVLAYHHEYGELEAHRFEVGGDGRLSPRPTLRIQTREPLQADWMEYWDAPLRRSYAAHLRAGQLHVYAQLVVARVAGRLQLPQIGVESLAEIDPATLAGAPEGARGRALHLRVRCSIAEERPTCEADGILATPAHRLLEGAEEWFVLLAAERDDESVASVLRLPEADGSAALLRFDSVSDARMSVADDHLDVLLRPRDAHAWLVHVPLSRLVGVIGAEPSELHRLNTPVDDPLIVASGAVLHRRDESEDPFFRGCSDSTSCTVRVGRLSPPHEPTLTLDHLAGNFWPVLGSPRLLVGGLRVPGDDEAAMVTLLEPSPPRRLGSAILPGLDSNWLHGPIRAAGPILTVPVEHRASVVVLRAQDDGSLTTLGTLTATRPHATDGCREHCPTWFANTQAFPREHDAIAVLGYEIVRARIGEDVIEETDRLDLLATLGE